MRFRCLDAQGSMYFLAQHYYLKLVDVLLWLEIIVSGVKSELLRYCEEQMTVVSIGHLSL